MFHLPFRPLKKCGALIGQGPSKFNPQEKTIYIRSTLYIFNCN